MHQPTTRHWSRIKRILWYVHSTIHYGLFILKKVHHYLFMLFLMLIGPEMLIIVPLQVPIIFLGANVTSWKKQKTVDPYSTEPNIGRSNLLLQKLLGYNSPSIGVTTTRPPTIYCDSVDTKYLFANPSFHSQIKHISIDFHSLHDKVQNCSYMYLMSHLKLN